MINADSTLLAKVRAFVFHARNYAKRLGTWLRSEDIKPVRQIVCVLAVAYLGIRFAPFALETNIRWAGLFLQLLGVVSVMHGLVGKGKVFDVPHPIGAIRRWWTKRPLWVQNVNVPLTGVAAFGEVGDVLSATAQTDASVQATIDERVSALERHIVAIREELPVIRKEQRQAEQRVLDRIEREQTQATEEFAEIRTRMKDAMVGDITLEWTGVGLLFVGLVLSTVSQEGARWFGR